jgi:hypothetical protein
MDFGERAVAFPRAPAKTQPIRRRRSIGFPAKPSLGIIGRHSAFVPELLVFVSLDWAVARPIIDSTFSSDQIIRGGNAGTH